MASNSPISPKPGKTKYESLGYLFGTPLSELDPNSLPIKLDIIRYWMNLVDTSRSSRKLSSNDKNQFRDNIITSIVSIWKSKGLEVSSEKAIKNKVERLINTADSYGKRTNRKVDSEWIGSERKKFKVLLDIGEASSTPATPAKRKSEEMVKI